MKTGKWNGKNHLKLLWCLAFIIIFIAAFVCFEQIRQQYVLGKYAVVGYMAEKEGQIDPKVLNEILSGSNQLSYMIEGKQYLEKNGYYGITENIFEAQISRYLIIWLLAVFIMFLLYYIYLKSFQKKLIFFSHGLAQQIDNYDFQEPFRLTEKYKDRSIMYLLETLNKKSVHIIQTMDILKAENQKISSYVDDVLHQLKTPLATLQLLIERLSMNEDNPVKVNKFEEAFLQIDKMTIMIKDVLSLSRLRSGKLVLNIQLYDLQLCIEDIIHQIIPLALGKGVTILSHIDVSLKLEYDEIWLKESILNILKNCIEHSPQGSVIEISAEKTFHYHALYIKDQGGGIAEKEKELIFSRFYTNNFSHSTDSTGIGLSLAKEIIGKHHGKIWVENNEDKGVTFSIILPILSGIEPYNSYFL